MSRAPASRGGGGSPSANSAVAPAARPVSGPAGQVSGYMADACALIMFFALPDPDGTMPNAAPLMRSQPVRVSPITLWEIVRKVAIGKLAPVWAPYPSLTQLLRAQMFTVQTLGWDEAEAANLLPPHHKDPTDRMLIATGVMHNLAILTDDRMFSPSGVKTIW